MKSQPEIEQESEESLMSRWGQMVKGSELDGHDQKILLAVNDMDLIASALNAGSVFKFLTSLPSDLKKRDVCDLPSPYSQIYELLSTSVTRGRVAAVFSDERDFGVEIGGVGD